MRVEEESVDAASVCGIFGVVVVVVVVVGGGGAVAVRANEKAIVGVAVAVIVEL